MPEIIDAAEEEAMPSSTDQSEQEEVVEITPEILSKRLNIVDHDHGFAVRFCKGPRTFLNWQAGLLISEKRSMRVGARWEARTVSLFHLRGYGQSQDEAVSMALKMERDAQ